MFEAFNHIKDCIIKGYSVNNNVTLFYYRN